MGRVQDHRAELAGLKRARWPAYLTEHSGLPGPRGTIELGQAVADAGDLPLFDALITTDDEYLTFCGVVGLGAVLAAGDEAMTTRLRRHAGDDRWRVREAVAMALQRLGDADLLRLVDLVLDWVDDPDPLVQRAATAVEVCRRATASLATLPVTRRRDPDARTLRQGLGYCWSVAVAADPGPGLVAFGRLEDVDDADVAWIARENRKKKRLATLLA
jgi:hypothetical protein